MSRRAHRALRLARRKVARVQSGDRHSERRRPCRDARNMRLLLDARAYHHPEFVQYSGSYDIEQADEILLNYPPGPPMNDSKTT